MGDMERKKILNGSKANSTMNRILDVNQPGRSFKELKGMKPRKKAGRSK